MSRSRASAGRGTFQCFATSRDRCVRHVIRFSGEEVLEGGSLIVMQRSYAGDDRVTVATGSQVEKSDDWHRYTIALENPLRKFYSAHVPHQWTLGDCPYPRDEVPQGVTSRGLFLIPGCGGRW